MKPILVANLRAAGVSKANAAIGALEELDLKVLSSVWSEASQFGSFPTFPAGATLAVVAGDSKRQRPMSFDWLQRAPHPRPFFRRSDWMF